MWQFLLAARAGGPERAELTGARSRKVTWRIDGPADASFLIDGHDPQAVGIDELVEDLVVARDGRRLFRGRIGTSGDDVDEEDHTATFNAVDYRGLLERRLHLWPATVTFTGVDQGEIVWTLIDDAQAQTGGFEGITLGEAGASVARDFTADYGRQVAAMVDQLAGLVNGFDWEIDAELRLNVWSPRRGTTEPTFIAQYGVTVSRVRRVVDPGTYCNVARASGEAGTTVAVEEVADIATRPEGRWERQVGFPDVSVAGTLVAKALGELAAGVLVPTYTVTLRPGVWTPDAVWLGDTVKVRVRSGRLDVDVDARVMEITVTVGDDGGETVELALGVPPRRWRDRFRRTDLAIEQLERR